MQREAARKVPNFAQPKFSIRNLHLSKKSPSPPAPPFGRLFALDQRPSKLRKVIHLNRHPICWVNREYSFT